MKVEQLLDDAKSAIEAGTTMTLVLPRPWKTRPSGFPRGELLCENGATNVYRVCPHKMLVWLKQNKLIPEDA